ncbi:hypothetical protein ACFLSF_04335 [Candidatus Bipolaricaulota bacterium]
MMKRTALLVTLALVGLASCALAASTLSGSSWLDVIINPQVGFEDMSFGTEIVYEFNGLTLSSDTLYVLPNLWVWQGFGAGGSFGVFGMEANVLFGENAQHLYTEAILTLGIAGIDVAFHSAQLGAGVFGGPADGWAIRATADLGIFTFTSDTEFGAQIEDSAYAGITIFHAATGLMRHYSTDPRVPGQNFTGQKFTIEYLDFCCSDTIAATLYMSCNGFEYLSLAATDILVPTLPWLTLDAELTYELQTKTLTLTPGLDLGDILCFDLFADLIYGATIQEIEGISITGLEIVCQLGPVTLREVALFGPSRGITTEAFGSLVLPVTDILASGMDYYPDYWQLLSVVYGDIDNCCGGEFTVIANAYFDDTASSLFEVALFHLEATIPYGKDLWFTFGLEAKPTGIDWMKFGFGVNW